MAEKKNFIVIAGNIGCGKTTLTQKLAETYNWMPFYESVQDNPYLDDFYKDMKRWSFPLQIYFLSHRFKTHKNIELSPLHQIQDRSIYEDAHIFARALFEQQLMCPRDYENYLNLYYSMEKLLQPPTLTIYLKRSIPKLKERIELRARECEKNIDINYLIKLNDYYDEWMANYSLGASLTIDTDERDFLYNDEDFNYLTEQMMVALKKNSPNQASHHA